MVMLLFDQMPSCGIPFVSRSHFGNLIIYIADYNRSSLIEKAKMEGKMGANFVCHFSANASKTYFTVIRKEYSLQLLAARLYLEKNFSFW